MTQQRTQSAERIREVRLQLQSIVEDLYWGDIEGVKIDDFQRNQAHQVYLFLKGVEYDLLHEQPVVEVEEQSEYDKIHAQYPDAICLFSLWGFLRDISRGRAKGFQGVEYNTHAPTI